MTSPRLVSCDGTVRTSPPPPGRAAHLGSPRHWPTARTPAYMPLAPPLLSTPGTSRTAPVRRTDLEVEVRDTDGVAGVAHEPDDLTRRHLRSELHRGGDAPRCRRNVLDAVGQIVSVHMEVFGPPSFARVIVMAAPEIPRSSSRYRDTMPSNAARGGRHAHRECPCPRDDARRAPHEATPTRRCSGPGQGAGTLQAETRRSASSDLARPGTR